MSKLFLPDVAPSCEDILLASFVPNINQPDQDAFPTLDHEAGEDYPVLVAGIDYSVLPQQNLARVLAETSKNGFAGKISKLLSASYQKTAEDTKWLGACHVRKYQLRQPQSLFNDLIKRKALRDWVKEEIEYGTDSLYFVVGYYTVFDATTYGDAQTTSEVKAEVKVPVEDIVTHGATALIPGMDALNLSVSGNAENGSRRFNASYQPGERIYAFCYRKVSFSFFARKNREDTAKLARDNCWVLTSENRGEDDGKNDEIVEAVLGEDDEGIDEEGFEMPDVGEVDADSAA